MSTTFRAARGVLLSFGLLVLLIAGGMLACRYEIGYYRHRQWIDAAATRYQVHPRLIAAVIWRESRFNPLCRGKAGELGFMQIMPGSAREWAKAEGMPAFDPESLLDPGTNILAGTWYLGRAIRRWNSQPDPLPYALAEYNAGRSNVIRWDRLTDLNAKSFTEVISYPTTRAYVKTVLRYYKSFGRPWERWGSEP
jgi:soluble lytic murein transglycosylase